MQNILPTYLSIGVSEERFWDGTPEDLKPYVIAFNNMQKRNDENNWQLGMYVQSAVSTAVSNCLYGKKSHAEYLKKPLYKLQEEKDHEEELTEDEKVQGRKQLLGWLMTQQANFELHHANDEREG